MENLKQILGKRIKQFRKKRNLTQQELADIVNMEVKSLSRIESGHNYPQYDNLVALSNALQIQPWELYFNGAKKDINKMREEIVKAMETDEKITFQLYNCLKIHSEF